MRQVFLNALVYTRQKMNEYFHSEVKNDLKYSRFRKNYGFHVTKCNFSDLLENISQVCYSLTKIWEGKVFQILFT